MAFSAGSTVDPHYRLLVKALKSRAKESLPDEATVNYCRIIRECSNAAWLVQSASGCDEPLLLFYGVTSTTPACRAYTGKEGAGVTVTSIPFSDKLLPALGIASSLYDDYLNFCECGHRLDHREVVNDRLSIKMAGAVCPSCGSTEVDMDVWRFS